VAGAQGESGNGRASARWKAARLLLKQRDDGLRRARAQLAVALLLALVGGADL